MFLIFGVSQGEKQLHFDQNIICRCCGQFGRIAVWVRYSYFMLFFIPLFKWDRHYEVRMSCCGSVCEISPELGRAVETGKVTFLDPGDLHFNCYHANRSPVHRCANCGYTTDEDFQFCPKCGKPF